jgi:hypothetical protein
MWNSMMCAHVHTVAWISVIGKPQQSIHLNDWNDCFFGYYMMIFNYTVNSVKSVWVVNNELGCEGSLCGYFLEGGHKSIESSE